MRRLCRPQRTLPSRRRCGYLTPLRPLFHLASPPGTDGGKLADLELCHRRRARCESRMCCAQGHGLFNLPLALRPDQGLVRNRPALGRELLAFGCRCGPHRQSPTLESQAAAPAAKPAANPPSQVTEARSRKMRLLALNEVLCDPPGWRPLRLLPALLVDRSGAGLSKGSTAAMPSAYAAAAPRLAAGATDVDIRFSQTHPRMDCVPNIGLR